MNYDNDNSTAVVLNNTGGVVVDPVTLTSKRVIYVGGLANETTIQLIRAAFIPFGNMKSVDMPMDYVKGLHRGFAFVEYDDPDDAIEAIFNMDGAELLGRSIQVSMAQANQIHKLTSAASGTGGSSGQSHSHRNNASTEAIWKSDEWFQQYAGGGGNTKTSDDNTMTEEQKLKAMDTEILKGR